MAFAEASVASFAALALSSDRLVLVDFHTGDCAPCRRLEPMLAALVRSVGDGLRVVRVDAAAAPDLAERYAVEGVPTLVLIRNGGEIGRRSGFQTAHQLRQWVRPHLP